MYFCLCFFISSSSGLTLKAKSIDENFAGSDVVVAVRITESRKNFVNGMECGTRYTALPFEVFKGASILEHEGKLEFGRSSGLYFGDRYILFLKKIERSAELMDKMLHAGLKIDNDKAADEMIVCQGLVPGLMFDDASAWRIEDGEVLVEGQLPNPVPGSISITRTGTASWSLRLDQLSLYFKSLERPLRSTKAPIK